MKLLNAETKKSDDIWLIVLAYYAESLRRLWWNPCHPGFNEFVAGLLASPQCPWHLQTAAALSEVRRKPLPGLDDETLCWSADLEHDQTLETIKARVRPEDRATPTP
jgi:hypothetical protein